MLSASKKIDFFSTDARVNLRNKTRLKRFLLLLFKSEKTKLNHLSYIFSDDNLLLELNQRFLKHNYRTDILTFPNANVNGISGEIYISIDRVKDNSKKYNTSFKEELHRVIFHGALHLCGYKDYNSGQKKLMVKKEDYYLSFYKSFT